MLIQRPLNWRPLLGKPGNVFPWLIADNFDVALTPGNINGSQATPGPCTRVAGATSSISAGNYSLNGGASTDNLWLNNPLTRLAGLILLIDFIITDVTQTVVLGFDNNTTNGAYNGLQIGSDLIKNVDAGSAGAALPFIPVDSTQYKVAIVLSAAGEYLFIWNGTNWLCLGLWGSNASSNLYASINNTSAIGTIASMRVPKSLWLPTPAAHDTFTRVNGNLGNSETAGPDGQATPAKAWGGSNTFQIASNVVVNTPVTLGSELVVNGDMEAASGGWTSNGAPTSQAQSNEQAHAGTYSWKIIATSGPKGSIQNINIIKDLWYLEKGYAYVSAGQARLRSLIGGSSHSVGGINPTTAAWTLLEGTILDLTTGTRAIYLDSYDAGANIIYFDDVTVKSMTFSELINCMEISTVDFMAKIGIVLPSTGRYQGGLILRSDSLTNPQNFILAYVDRIAAKLEVYKVLSGVYTQIFSTAITYSAGAYLRAYLNGSQVTFYYNESLVNTTQTISDAAILSNTKVGIFSTSPNVTLDLFSAFPVKDTARDAYLNGLI